MAKQLFLLVTVCVANVAAITITKTWNGCVTRNEKVVLAARVASDQQINVCSWVKKDERDNDDDIYSSEDRGRNGVAVEIDRDGSLCRLIIDRADRNRHDGEWEVRVMGDCDDQGNKRRKKRDVNNNNKTNISKTSGNDNVSVAVKVPASANVVRRSGLATRLRDRDDVNKRHRLQGQVGECGNHAWMDNIKLNVVSSDDDLCAVAGQERVYGANDDEVVISARVNTQPRSCTLRFDRRDAVQVSDVGRERCNRGFLDDASVCCTNSFSSSDRIFACNCRIQITTNDLAGRWEIVVENEDRRRETVRTELVVYELPRAVIMRFKGREVRDNGRISHTDDGRMDMECEIEDIDRDAIKPKLRLAVGPEMLTWLKDDTCQRSSSRDECVHFEVMPTRRMLNQQLCCVAHYPGLDMSEHESETHSCADVDFDDYAAGLVNTERRQVRVCDSRARVGDTFETEIIFDARPRPDRVEWTFRARRGRSVQVEEGRERGDFAAYELEEDDDERDRYGAGMKIDRLSRDDLNVENNILLEVDNDVGRVQFEITIDNTDECESKRFQSNNDDDDDDDNNADYRCNVDRDSDCRCNNLSGSRRRCCDNSLNCRESECCERCRSTSDRDCDLCDRNDRRCMRLATSNDDDDDVQGFQCDVDDEPDCRCDSNGSNRRCCNADTNCRGSNCCGDRCNNRDDRDCTYCDDRGRDCYTLDRNEPSTDVCRKGDRECVCVDGPNNDEFCCSDRSGCRGRECCDFCQRGDDDCYCDRNRRNCVVVDKRTEDIEDKAKNVMLDSCIKLSRTLLDYWQTDGDRRDSVPSDREVSDDIENFFNTARCTGFDDDIREYVEGEDFRSSPFSRDHRHRGSDEGENFGDADLSFQSLKPGQANKVEKVNRASKPVDKVALSPQAQTIVDLATQAGTKSSSTSE